MNKTYRYFYKTKFQRTYVKYADVTAVYRLYRLACSMQYHGTHLQTTGYSEYSWHKV